MTTSTLAPNHPSEPSPLPVYDILTIGFGTTALSLAANLASTNPQSPPTTLHLETKPQSAWSPGPSLPSAHMSTSFISDLVTSNNPRSKYTFVNFLSARNLLVDYTNLGRVQPSRELVRAYLRWCGEELIRDGAEVRFGYEVVGVEALKGNSGAVEAFKVLARAGEGVVKEWRARKVVYAMGVRLFIPPTLSDSGVRGAVVHAAELREELEKRDKEGWKGRDVAVVGGGQHAAEVTEYLNSKVPRYKVTILMEERHFRADEDTAFTTTTLQTPHALYPPELIRGRVLHESTPYPTASAPLLDSLYEAQYNQRIPSRQNPNRTSTTRFFSSTTVTGARRDNNGKIILSTTSDGRASEEAFDLVVSATGYRRHNYGALFAGLTSILDGIVSVNCDYAVNFRRGVLQEGCGVWVLGMLGGKGEDDVDDALFRILCERSRRVVASMFGDERVVKGKQSEVKTVKSKEAVRIEDQARL
ncbi:uncharacterized protein BDZ99DRAFT_577274 [Mytilinidion resinicola]|uniref:L-ornithine N(5)-monooxygenase [NAD(P)H] n=1 Tax=Mytilinidion resinicola TaxID=574789 RepID=A0A6A6XZ22_9PEZI|nr:uncharacterized protein BDZ99DRAFT_577274 [Mytilinidion resinicola]KAF2801816.1 hypothetical protein BDZ99DRAFT_577274 [Mytilinidion resinicola]